MIPLAPIFQDNINTVEDFEGGVKVGRAFTLETGNDSFRFKVSAATTEAERKKP